MRTGVPASQKQPTENTKGQESWVNGKIAKTAVIVLVVAVLVWVLVSGIVAVATFVMNSFVVHFNNVGWESFDSGDAQSAINQLRSASDLAVTNTDKVNSLKNLAYVYESEGLYDDAHDTYTEALSLTSEGSFDYHLISGEIALLEDRPNTALVSYNNAYEKNQNDVQINGGLALFYLDIEDTHPQYVDYLEALSYAKRAYEFDTEKSQASKQTLAIAYFYNNDYNQAISLLSTSNLTQHPDAGFWLGLAYLSDGDETNGCYYLQKFANAADYKLNPSNFAEAPSCFKELR